MEPIAIIGMSCLFPDAETPEQFWQNLVRGVDSTTEATAAEMGVDPNIFYEPTGSQTDTFYCKRGAYVRDFSFDGSGYAIDDEILSSLESTYQWTLYVAKSALHDSGYLDRLDRLATCGIMLGSLSFPTRTSNQQTLPIYRNIIENALGNLLQQTLTLPGLPDDEAGAHRVAHGSGTYAATTARALGLGGATLELDAACASSLYAIKLACDYLHSGSADLMLAGAVSCADPFFINMGFSSFHAYPQDGVSRPFDNSSGGLIAGEGAGMLVLKRYADARRDGDHIYAVLRGIGLSNDGRGKSLLSPHPKGQALAYERAYAAAELEPQSIEYIECHATGTPLGDQTEVRTLEEFFGSHGAVPLIGSVKSNLGHLLTAAGMASIIKVILSMEKGQIPATININEPIQTTPVAPGDNAGSGVQIVRGLRPWPHLTQRETPKRAAINAFGFGGTNAHVILEAPSESLPEVTPVDRTSKRARVATTDSRLAIVGMDVLFGGCDGLDEFARTIYEGQQHFETLPPQRWHGIDQQPSLLHAYGFDQGRAPTGAYLADFDFDFFRFGIPPNAEDQPIPQQLLMLKVADRAICDAALPSGQNAAVIVAMNTDPTLHRFRGRCDLSWQINAALEREGITLTENEKAELITLAKDSIYPAANAAQYASFIGNIIAGRIAALRDFSGPAFTVSSQENGTFHALEIAARLLADGTVDAVVVGAVELAGSPESVLLRNQRWPLNTGQQSLSYAEGAQGWLVGEGAGAVVLKRHADARSEHQRIYASIDAITVLQDLPAQPDPAALPHHPSTETVQQACWQTLQSAQLQPHAISYLELSGSGLPQHNAAEIAGIQQAYTACAQTPLERPHCAIGSAKANIGHTFAASGMASLIKSALCLQQRFIPATPGWTRPGAALNLHERFYAPTESRPWLRNNGDSNENDTTVKKRFAAISGIGMDGTCAHLILSESPGMTAQPKARAEAASTYLTQTPPYLFPLAGDTQAELLEQLAALEQAAFLNAACGGDALANLARGCFERYQKREQAGYALCLLAHTPDELRREIEWMRQGLEQGVAESAGSQTEWKTPLGSYFTPNPLGLRGEVAFVYPGIFNSYVGMGRDLLYLFPHLHDYLETNVPRPGETLAEHHLYPRTLARLSDVETKARQARFMADGHAMLESGSTFAILLTRMLVDTFDLRPARAFGYSLGESAMLLALGAWPVREADRLRFRASPFFNTRVAGPKEAVREFWHVPETEPGAPPWAVYIVRASAEAVREALRNEERVYLTHINTPHQVVIAGDPSACERVIEWVECDAMLAPFDSVIHCEAMQSEYDELFKINTRPLQPVADIRFHFAANETEAPPTQESIAHWISQGCCQPLDFPRLVHRVYEAGARIFIEVGARSTCSRWIHDILDEREHVALAVNHTRQSDRSALVGLLAQLVSHRVAVDLRPLYAVPQEPATVTATKQRSLVKTIPLGGTPIADVILSAENRQRFGRIMARHTHQEQERPHDPEPTPSPAPAWDGYRNPINEQTVPPRTLGGEKPITPPTLPSFPTREAQQPVRAGSPSDRHRSMLREQISQVTNNHKSLLALRSAGSRHMAELIRLQMQMQEAVPPQSPLPDRTLPVQPEPPPPTPSQPANPVWNEAELLEFAGGSIANVFGPDYAVIDSYVRRVRLPMPPYLLVSRVTELDAEPGQFRPSFMQTEYDVPHSAWYGVDGQVPTAVAVESGQCDLLLISYIGIDFENQGVLVYRLLDCSLTFLDKLPHEGQTLRYDIRIDSYARSGKNLLFFFHYDCYADGELILKMRNGCAGFFSDADLAQGKGVVMTEAERAERAQIQKRHFAPLLRCHKSTFTRNDLHHLSRGDFATCFGAHYAQEGLNPSLRYPNPQMIMLDRITTVELDGGAWGLGRLVAEQDLAPDDWYFPCHFKDDEVLAGSLMAEGCVQLLQFYMLYLGLQTTSHDARFQPIPNLEQTVRCRGQVTPRDTKLIYELEIMDIGLSPHPYVKGYARLILDGKVIVDFQNLGLQLIEKNPNTQSKQPTASSQQPTAKRHPQFSPHQITEFATGSMANCFGPEFAIYDQPHRRSSRTPNGDLQLMSRVLHVDGERLRFDNQPSLTSEYDVPSDPWFVQQVTAPTIPYSIYMEIALQPCGFLSAYLGSTLLFPEQDFQFRNLDGTGELLAELDLRGKAITNVARLLASTALEGVIIQEFAFELRCDEQLFFRGTASFGYFTAQALAAQRGLDGGKRTSTWLESTPLPAERIHPVDLHRPPAPPAPAHTLDACMPIGQLRFLGQCSVVPDGGIHGRGYVQGQLAIAPDDWFFGCHFYQDPVMPGSLGVEAIIEAMKEFARFQRLGEPFQRPTVTQRSGHETIWKYRGQIVPGEGPVTVEVHITEVAVTADEVTVVGDASLWKDGLRIYAVQQAAICIRERGTKRGNQQ